MPGVLPVLNRTVVDFTLRMALATGCTIAPESRFARKNYFYPDLPKGYQISQYELPIAESGRIDIEIEGRPQRVRIRRIHMEEDAGKLSHDPQRPVSRVDLNRTGVPLIEIVSEPDIGSPAAAGAYLRKLRAIVRYLGICDGNLEEGSFRCDANVSIRPRGSSGLGTRTELKNLNSFRFVEKAIEYEINRQKDVLLDGGAIVQETRLWDSSCSQTFSMRSKEEAHDYRYFPDPDLLPLMIDTDWIDRIRQTLPELPDARRDRFVEQLGLPAYDAGVLTSDRELADYFEECLADVPKPKPVANWILGPLLGLLNTNGITIDQSPIHPAELAGLVNLIDSGAISAKIAKAVFDEMAVSGRAAAAIVTEKGLSQINDTDAIEPVIREVLARNPKEVEAFRAGKSKLMGFFVGEVMKATRGQANPKAVNELLRKRLER
jgi:aspartyl-tRNA(Asn)/glutamyl-tRNA(Gln) amidotransferase subunit B